MLKCSLAHRRNLYVPTPFLKYSFITTLALLNYETRSVAYTHEVVTAKLNFNFVRKRTFASYIRSLTRASRYTPVYASTYIIVTMKSMELDRTEPPTSDEPRAARFARRNKSSLNFRCSAIPSAGPPSNAMGVKRSNCGRTEAVLH